MDEPWQIAKRGLIVLAVIAGCVFVCGFVYTLVVDNVGSSQLGSQLGAIPGSLAERQAGPELNTVKPYLSRVSKDINRFVAYPNGFVAGSQVVRDVKRGDPGLRIGLMPKNHHFSDNVIYVVTGPGNSDAESVSLEIVSSQGYRFAAETSWEGNAADGPIELLSKP